MKYELVDELRVTYPVSWLLEIAYIKPASYYKWRKNNHKREEKVRDEQEIREHILGIHFMHPEYGRPRITDELNEKGLPIDGGNEHPISHPKKEKTTWSYSF